MKFSLQAMLILASLILIASALPALAQCTDADSDGYFYELGCGTAQDCNDADAGANPGIALDECDGFDNDCDGFIDEDPACSGVLAAMIKGQHVELTNPDVNARTPAMAWTGDSYGVFWQDARTSRGYFGLLDINGNRLIEDVPLFDTTFPINYPDLVWTGKEFGLVWQDGRPEDGPLNEVYFTIFNAQGQRLIGDVKVTTQENHPEYPKVVWNGQGYGVFWFDDRAESGTSLTYFRPISAAGVPGTEVFLDIANDDPPGHDFANGRMAAVWDGDFYGLAIWKVDYTDLYNRRIYHYFVRLDREGNQESLTQIVGLLIESGYMDTLLTWNGEQYGYWWNLNVQIQLTRLYPDGSFVNPSDKHVQVTSHPWGSSLNRAEWNGDEYGLLYRWQIYGTKPEHEVRFNRVAADGTLLATGINISTNCGNDFLDASMAWNGSGFGVIWHDAPVDRKQLFFNNVGNDYDLDGRAGRRDCDDGDARVWALAGAVSNLTLVAATQTLSWDAPQETGTDLDLTYDVLRSENAADFLAAGCVESGISGLSADDSAEPLAGAVYHYLVRANNGCGEGSLGNGAGGVPRSGSSCP